MADYTLCEVDITFCGQSTVIEMIWLKKAHVHSQVIGLETRTLRQIVLVHARSVSWIPLILWYADVLWQYLCPYLCPEELTLTLTECVVVH